VETSESFNRTGQKVLTGILKNVWLRVLLKRVKVLSYLKLGSVCLGLLFVLATASHSFQETASGGVGATGSLAVVEQKRPAKATDDKSVTFPGLGALGVLPKLDFGLELLYGDGDTPTSERRTEELDSEGLQIKGTLKHRF